MGKNVARVSPKTPNSHTNLQLVDLAANHCSAFGAHLVNGRWYFNLYSASATEVELLLFETDNIKHPTHRVPLHRDSYGRFSCEMSEDLDGLLYCYRVNNTEHLLLDPYASEIGQEFSWTKDGYTPALGVIRFPTKFNWQGVKKPARELSRTVIYEAHAKGLTMLQEHVPTEERGTFIGLCQEEVIEHLKSLGVTALQILPITYHVDEEFLWRRGHKNYWGYNPVNHFAVHPRFAVKNSSLSVSDQFRTFVREYHRAGLEVYLDVVFNHTGEASYDGPVVSFRGIDRDTYYRHDALGYIDWTGCGNTLNTDNEKVIHLICDSLRYWAEEMQVDGFRFDLASALARSGEQFTPRHPLLIAISQDPVLQNVKMIAEPWDATVEGYQLGKFPAPWKEWNDRYRDTVRRFWRGDGGLLGEFATRLSGSSDLFYGRSSADSINFLTAHDGFSLRDVVSYTEKRNEENEQENRDGHNANYSANYGEEGETDDPRIISLRMRQMKNMLTTLFISNGTPMLLMGDEFGRTQSGNNNAYCHDVEWNYLKWSTNSELKSWIEKLADIRGRLNWVEDEKFFSADELKWFNSLGESLTGKDWNNEHPTELIALYSRAIEEKDLLIVFNPRNSATVVQRPWTLSGGITAELVLSTAPLEIGFPLVVPANSMALISCWQS